MISVSIGAEVRKILRRLVHFEHPRHDETRNVSLMFMLVRSVGCHKLPAGVWGEAPAANGFFWHNKTHSRTKNANYWRFVIG